MEEPNSNPHFLLQIRRTSQQTNINLLIRLAGTVFKPKSIRRAGMYCNMNGKETSKGPSTEIRSGMYLLIP